ncbi:energy-coupling factor transporter transmembrane component T [Neobacillus sp. PS3-40]|uniref:energy-coupling factor transporter transmembrane component T n=1 Tax=Neobacillus sp. PS3-40 TaxID=3070679 RepID=UPI0027DF5315|nr:energy-coupling factor transporter transmembrane component T [Neobacillus sp. PS3-40]WML44204.1 energy-coupling factor transporter transmembrane component T [Neobacillus sp. PS3-40]
MSNRFERFHPLVSFMFYAGSLSLLILMLHPIFLLIGFVVILAINYHDDRLSGLRRWVIFIMTTGLLIIFFNPLFNERGRHTLFEIGQHRFTVEAVTYGGMSAFSIMGVMALFVSYNEVMTPNKLLFLFSKFMPQFAILLMLTLRFIPLMRRRLAEISAIQMSKGISVRNGKWKSRVKAGMQYVQVLLTYSLEEAIQTADSMKARGYGRGKQRSSYEYFRFQKKDGIALLYLVVLFVLILIGRFLGYGLLNVYPLMESWRFTSMDTACLITYLLFLCFPLLVEMGGMNRWRISN